MAKNPSTAHGTVSFPEFGDLLWKWQLAVECPKCQADADIAPIPYKRSVLTCPQCGWRHELESLYDGLVRAIIRRALAGTETP